MYRSHSTFKSLGSTAGEAKEHLHVVRFTSSGKNFLCKLICAALVTLLDNLAVSIEDGSHHPRRADAVIHSVYKKINVVEC